MGELTKEEAETPSKQVFTTDLNQKVPFVPHEQAITTIYDYLQAMADSNRRMTADIFYYTIRTKEWHPSYGEEYGGGEGSESRTVYADPDGDATFSSREELIKHIKKGFDFEEDSENDIYGEDEDRIEGEILNYIEYPQQSYWAERGMFLTEKEARAHLKANHYHYSSDAHTYVKHAWRAPEMLAFFKALFEYFGAEKKWG